MGTFGPFFPDRSVRTLATRGCPLATAEPRLQVHKNAGTVFRPSGDAGTAFRIAGIAVACGIVGSDQKSVASPRSRCRPHGRGRVSQSVAAQRGSPEQLGRRRQAALELARLRYFRHRIDAGRRRRAGRSGAARSRDLRRVVVVRVSEARAAARTTSQGRRVRFARLGTLRDAEPRLQSRYVRRSDRRCDRRIFHGTDGPRGVLAIRGLCDPCGVARTRPREARGRHLPDRHRRRPG
jgi:hypothetical protein